MSQRTDPRCFYLSFPPRGRIFSFCSVPRREIGLSSGRDGQCLGLISESEMTCLFSPKSSTLWHSPPSLPPLPLNYYFPNKIMPVKRLVLRCPEMEAGSTIIQGCFWGISQRWNSQAGSWGRRGPVLEVVPVQVVRELEEDISWIREGLDNRSKTWSI